MSVALSQLLSRQPRLDFDRWRDMVMSIMGAGIEDATERFGAQAALSRIGDLGLIRYEASPHRMERTRRLVERNDSHCYLASLQVRGTSVLRQGKSEILMSPGHAAIIDCRRPSALHMVTAGLRVTARLPGDIIADRLGRDNWIGLRRLNGCVLTSIFDHLAGPGQPASPAADSPSAKLAANALADLVASSPRVKASGPHLTEVLLMDFLERHYRDSSLSPAAAAAHLGISVRAVHKTFDQARTTFGRWLLARRLDACRDALAGANSTKILISDIALSHGFNDVSHFNHAFKSRYGEPPRSVLRRLNPHDRANVAEARRPVTAG